MVYTCGIYACEIFILILHARTCRRYTRAYRISNKYGRTGVGNVIYVIGAHRHFQFSNSGSVITIISQYTYVAIRRRRARHTRHGRFAESLFGCDGNEVSAWLYYGTQRINNVQPELKTIGDEGGCDWRFHPPVTIIIWRVLGNDFCKSFRWKYRRIHDINTIGCADDAVFLSVEDSQIFLTRATTESERSQHEYIHQVHGCLETTRCRWTTLFQRSTNRTSK